jgi:hypothetical protein
MALQSAAEKPWFGLLMPMHRMANANTFACVQQAVDAGVRLKFLPHVGDALIGRARAVMATNFLLNVPTEYAIFVDSDIMFQPEHLQRIFDKLQAGYDLIGGLYTVRYGKQPASYGTGPHGNFRLDGTVQEMRYLSTGFMGIRKRLLQKMVDELELPLCHPRLEKFKMYPFFESYPFYDEANKEWIYLSEDWGFCELARKVGVKPYLDTSVSLGHEGFKIWTVKDLPADAVKQVNKLVIPNRAQVEATTSRPPALSLVR